MEDFEQEHCLLYKNELPSAEHISENLENDIYTPSRGRNFFNSIRSQEASPFLIILAHISIFLNAVLLVFIFLLYPSRTEYNPLGTSLVGLFPNAVEQIVSAHTQYSHPPLSNNTLRDELWSNIQYDRGMVFVDEDTVFRLGLEEARTFPWDPSKRVYFMNIFHQLHCLRGMYEAFTYIHNGGALEDYEHWVHCLDALRQDVICVADDGLLSVDEPHVREVGDGHVRQCRNFSKLDEWALEHHACYSFEDVEAPYFVNQRYANCPRDSPYFEIMRESFGFDEDWEPANPPKTGPTFPR